MSGNNYDYNQLDILSQVTLLNVLILSSFFIFPTLHVHYY